MNSFFRIAIIHLVLAISQSSAQNAYIANQATSSVSVVSLANPGQIAPTIPVGKGPFGVAVSPDGTHVFVTNAASGNVSVIATASNSVIATIPVGTDPQGVAVTPDTTKVYVANTVDGTVSVISAASNTVTATIPIVGGPYGLAVSHDGTKVYATNTISGSVSVISVASNTVTGSIPVGQSSLGLAVSPDGTTLYVASRVGANGALFVIDTAADSVITTIPMGSTPTGVAVTPDGAKVYVADQGQDTVWVVATATSKITPILQNFIVPRDIALTPDGGQAYVVCEQSAFIIDTATNTVADEGVPMLLGPSAFGIFIQPPPPKVISPSILEITPNIIPASSPAVTLRIVGTSLQGAASAPCTGAAESVTWNTTPLAITSASDTEIDVTVPANLLTSIGIYTVTVSVNQISGGSCTSLLATSTVQVGTPMLGVSPTSLSFQAPPGSLPPSQSLQVTSVPGALSFTTAVQYAAGGPTGWIAVSPGTGTAAQGAPSNLTISITVAAQSYSLGLYHATISITAGSQIQTIAVTLNISASFSVPATMVFGAVAGLSPPGGAQDWQTLTVTAIGAPVVFTYSTAPLTSLGAVASCATSSLTTPLSTTPGWLYIDGAGSATSGRTLPISVFPYGLAPGTYADVIQFVTPGYSASTNAYLVVQQPVATFNFSYTIGGSAPGPQNTPLFTSGCGVSGSNMTLGVNVDDSWLTASLNPSGETFSVTMTALPVGMTPGTYKTALAVTDASGEVWTFAVILTVSPSPKTATTTQLAVSPNPAAIGQTVLLTASVAPAPATGSVTFYDGQTSIGTAALSSGMASFSRVFIEGGHSLTASYSGDTTHAASLSPIVELVVNPFATSISVSASPASQTFGSPVVLTATLTPSTATGTVTFLNGQAPVGTATVSGGSASLTTASLAVGIHSLTASYSGDASDLESNSPAINVTVTVANQPVIQSGGIVNAASYAAMNGAGSPVAPGSLVAIFTSALATQSASFTTATLPLSLGGVSVSFNGIPAPMVQVVPAGAYPFVSAQVPFEVLTAGQTSATVPAVITVNGVPSAPAQTKIVASQPGIFTLNADGTGQAVLVNLADYTIAAPSGATPGAHPIPRGQTAFFYVTGLGAMTPFVVDGSGVCSAANSLCSANAMPTVTVGGVPAQVAFAGQAPGYPGVAQINLTIPFNAPTGDDVSLIVTSADGAVTSNAATVAVQ